MDIKYEEIADRPPHYPASKFGKFYLEYYCIVVIRDHWLLLSKIGLLLKFVKHALKILKILRIPKLWLWSNLGNCFIISNFMTFHQVKVT